MWEILEEPNSRLKSSKLDDIVITTSVLLSIFGLVISSNKVWFEEYGTYLNALFLITDLIFLFEYILRVYASKVHHGRLNYIFSPLPLFDLVSLLPLFTQFEALRILRVFTLFRVVKFARYNKTAWIIFETIKRSFTKLVVASIFAFFVILFLGTLLWVFERDVQPDKFGDILSSTWAAAITLATIGYGDSFAITLGGKIATILVYMWGGGFVIGIPVAILNDTYQEVQNLEYDYND